MVLIYFILGLAVGSFLNVVIYRLGKGKKFSEKRSYCPNCKKNLKWFELVPIFSFVVQRGKCRYCGKRISWQYPLVELVTGLLFVFNFLLVSKGFGLWLSPDFFNLVLIRNFVFISALVLIFVYDLKYYLILDKITLPAAAFALLVNLLIGVSLYNLLLSAIIGGGFFLLQYLVSRGRWIGGGDIRLGALMGLMLGWPQILTALFLAYVIGAFVSLILVLVSKKKWSSQVPFGTFLSLATVGVLFFGPQIVDWYLKLVAL